LKGRTKEGRREGKCEERMKKKEHEDRDSQMIRRLGQVNAQREKETKRVIYDKEFD
jgi:hypothetical protein